MRKENTTKFDTPEIQYIKNHISDPYQRRKAILQSDTYRAYYRRLARNNDIVILAIDLASNKEIIFNSYKECIAYLNKATNSKSKNKRQKICDCLYHRRKSYLGYKFQLIEQEETENE